MCSKSLYQVYYHVKQLYFGISDVCFKTLNVLYMTGEPRGFCTDSAAMVVGALLENFEAVLVSEGHDLTSYNFSFMWGQWLAYLPLCCDQVGPININRPIGKPVSCNY